jgi:hypothetical protein
MDEMLFFHPLDLSFLKSFTFTSCGSKLSCKHSTFELVRNPIRERGRYFNHRQPHEEDKCFPPTN